MIISISEAKQELELRALQVTKNIRLFLKEAVVQRRLLGFAQETL